MRNKRSADIASDHHLLIGEIRLRIARIHPQEEKIWRRFNTRRLEDAAVNGAPMEWSAIKNAFIATSENNLGELHTRRKQWIRDETLRKEEYTNAKTAIERAKIRGAKAVAR